MPNIPAIIAKNGALWKKASILPNRRTAESRERAKQRSALTVGRLKELLRSEPETGKFFWLTKTSNRINIGDEAGAQTGDYIEIGVEGRRYLAHRLAWFYMTGVMPVRQIDHRDTCKANNKWGNLREATHGQNVQNTGARRNNKCGLKGVSFSQSAQKWHARIMHERTLYLLGYFDTPEAAHAAYTAAAARLHGEFARTQ